MNVPEVEGLEHLTLTLESKKLSSFLLPFALLHVTLDGLTVTHIWCNCVVYRCLKFLLNVLYKSSDAKLSIASTHCRCLQLHESTVRRTCLNYSIVKAEELN